MRRQCLTIRSPRLSSPVMFSIKYSKQFLSYRILKSNRFKYIWRYGLGLRSKVCAQGGVCVLYCGRLVVPTVLRKAETRVPPARPGKSCIRIQWLNRFARRRELEKVRWRRRRDGRPAASSKVASEANLSRARGRELGRKKEREKSLQNKQRIGNEDLMIPSLMRFLTGSKVLSL